MNTYTERTERRNILESPAIIDRSGLYRYSLLRQEMGCTEEHPVLVFCMLNPSTADHEKNDPTVTRCINYMKAWEYKRLVVVNAYAYRSPDPRLLKQVQDPVGSLNNSYIWMAASMVARLGGRFVCAWGANIEPSRSTYLQKLIRGVVEPRVLALTKGGEPRHPLYLKADLKPISWRTC